LQVIGYNKTNYRLIVMSVHVHCFHFLWILLILTNWLVYTLFWWPSFH